MIVAVTGTPGTGKTTLSQELAKELDVEYVDVHNIIIEHKLDTVRDEERDCVIIDVDELTAILLNMLHDGMVIDSHLSHELPPEKIDVCVVCTCDLKELQKRLHARGYADSKVRENIDAEIFDTCKNEALEKGHTVLVVDTTNGYDIADIIKNARKLQN